MSLRVALIDDHQPFRERLRALLEEDPDIEIVAEASSGNEILEIALTTGLTAYDASYLWLARQLAAELVTLDKELRQAAAMR